MKVSGGVRTEGKLDTHNVDIAELVEPEVVQDVRGRHEIADLELLVDLGSRGVELVEDPFFYEALFSCRLNVLFSQRFHDG